MVIIVLYFGFEFFIGFGFKVIFFSEEKIIYKFSYVDFNVLNRNFILFFIN